MDQNLHSLAENLYSSLIDSITAPDSEQIVKNLPVIPDTTSSELLQHLKSDHDADTEMIDLEDSESPLGKVAVDLTEMVPSQDIGPQDSSTLYFTTEPQCCTNTIEETISPNGTQAITSLTGTLDSESLSNCCVPVQATESHSLSQKIFSSLPPLDIAGDSSPNISNLQRPPTVNLYTITSDDTTSSAPSTNSTAKKGSKVPQDNNDVDSDMLPSSGCPSIFSQEQRNQEIVIPSLTASAAIQDPMPIETNPLVTNTIHTNEDHFRGIDNDGSDDFPSSSLPPSSSPSAIFSCSPLPLSQSSPPSSQSKTVEGNLDIGKNTAPNLVSSYVVDSQVTEKELPLAQVSGGSVQSPVLSVVPVNHPLTGLSSKRRLDDNAQEQDERENQEKNNNKRAKISSPVRTPLPPAPKRPTSAFHKLQREKLAQPFRSPAMRKTFANPSDASDNPVAQVIPMVYPALPAAVQSKEVLHSKSTESTAIIELSVTSNTLTPAKKYTTKAASQFKSPFSVAPSASISSVRMTPTVQALERKIQILKRAIKVRKDDEEKTLEDLVIKWVTAGREVAWELWGLVKDTGSEDHGKSRGRTDGWGWDEAPKKWDNNWGWESDDNKNKSRNEDTEEWRRKQDVDENEEKRQDTLGTMLRQLGIASETLGWDEDSGEFIDID